jgi:hypothetical protein
MSEIGDLPEGVVAYREYRVSLDGESGSVAITLGKPDADTMPGKFARHVGACAYGLVSIVGLEGAPRLPAVWVLSDTKVGLVVQGEDHALGDKLKSLIARYIGVFFADIEPELTALRINIDTRPGRTLN